MMLNLNPIKVFALLTFSILLSSIDLKAQENNSEIGLKKFPIIVGFQFQNFATPFRDLGSNFTHPGLFVGSEIYYNEKKTLVQQASIGGYLNKEIGNGIFVQSQFGFRPSLFGKVYGELKAGLSYLRVSHPSQAYKYEDGKWKETSGGKSQLGIPLDFGLGYRCSTKFGETSPFVAYQITPALFYNETLPLNLYSSIIIGLRVHLHN